MAKKAEDMGKVARTGLSAKLRSERAKKAAETRKRNEANRQRQAQLFNGETAEVPIGAKVPSDAFVDDGIITVRVPRELLKKVQGQLDKIGQSGTVEELVRSYLRVYARLRRTFGLLDEITFGKYAGELVGTLIRTQPDYIRWCLENIETFQLDTEAQRSYDEAIAAFTGL